MLCSLSYQHSLCVLLFYQKTSLQEFDKYRKHYLWRGSDINAKKPPKAAWKMVCVPKAEGGLGVIDIGKQNKALLTKNLHKFFNILDLPWVKLIWEKHYRNGKLPNHIRNGSFWWRDNLKLLPDFKNIAMPQINNGETSLFWHDRWANQPLTISMPELFSFAVNKLTTVQEAFNQDDLTDPFQLPLSQIAFEKMQNVQHLIEASTLNDENDKWIYSWGSSIFASAKVYKILVGHSDIHPTYKWLWKSNYQPKHKVFFGC